MKKSVRPYRLLAAAALFILVNGCSKDDTVNLPVPVVKFSASTDTVKTLVKDSAIIEATETQGLPVIHEWTMVDTILKGPRFAFKAPQEGYYKVEYTATSSDGKIFTKTFTIAASVSARPITGSSSKYISTVYGYLPAPGQFVNEDGLGSADAADGLIGGSDALVSLGAYGGYVIFGFDHSITNKNGHDLAIYGNALMPPWEWSEPGIVMVSRDVNGNGQPDDPWYELAGSEYHHAATRKQYTITYYNPKGTLDVPWKDNLGNTGSVQINPFHDHNYYPLFAANQDSISFSGTVLRNTFGIAPGTSIYINESFPWGYTDSWSSGDDYGNNRYNAFDISWAVNGQGAAVALPYIDFVKVYTAQNNNGNTLLGEISTEIGGAADLNMP